MVEKNRRCKQYFVACAPMPFLHSAAVVAAAAADGIVDDIAVAGVGEKGWIG